MDAAYRNPTRRFPGHTNAELEASLTRTTDSAKYEAIKAEIAARKAGTSKAFAVPQVVGGQPIIGRFKS